jgi:hypothetical protein
LSHQLSRRGAKSSDAEGLARVSHLEGKAAMANDDKWTAEDEERLQRAMRSTVRKAAERERDLKLAIGLLNGGWGNQRGAKRCYNAAEEKLGRKALARLLRNEKPLDSGLRQQLAALFD